MQRSPSSTSTATTSSHTGNGGLYACSRNTQFISEFEDKLDVIVSLSYPDENISDNMQPPLPLPMTTIFSHPGDGSPTLCEALIDGNDLVLFMGVLRQQAITLNIERFASETKLNIMRISAFIQFREYYYDLENKLKKYLLIKYSNNSLAKAVIFNERETFAHQLLKLITYKNAPLIEDEIHEFPPFQVDLTLAELEAVIYSESKRVLGQFIKKLYAYYDSELSHADAINLENKFKTLYENADIFQKASFYDFDNVLKERKRDQDKKKQIILNLKQQYDNFTYFITNLAGDNLDESVSSNSTHLAISASTATMLISSPTASSASSATTSAAASATSSGVESAASTDDEDEDNDTLINKSRLSQLELHDLRPLLVDQFQRCTLLLNRHLHEYQKTNKSAKFSLSHSQAGIDRAEAYLQKWSIFALQFEQTNKNPLNRIKMENGLSTNKMEQFNDHLKVMVRRNVVTDIESIKRLFLDKLNLDNLMQMLESDANDELGGNWDQKSMRAYMFHCLASYEKIKTFIMTHDFPFNVDTRQPLLIPEEYFTVGTQSIEQMKSAEQRFKLNQTASSPQTGIELNRRQ